MTYAQAEACSNQDYDQTKGLSNPMPANVAHYHLVESSHGKYDNEGAGHCNRMQ